MKSKTIVPLIFVLIAISSIYIYFKKTNVQKDNTTLVVGTVANYAPWVSVNKQGEFEGFDVDVINNVTKTLNKKLVLRDLGSMTSLFLALEQGSIDAIIWGLSITEDRLKKVAMIRYQGDIVKSYPLIFWGKIPSTIKSINDMNGMTVCVEPSSSQDVVLSQYTFINKKPTERVDDALLNIQYGKTDAAFVEPAIAKKFKNNYPEIQLLDVPLSTKNKVYGVGITIKKSNTKLIEQIQQTIKALQQAGIIKELETKWDIA